MRISLRIAVSCAIVLLGLFAGTGVGTAAAWTGRGKLNESMAKHNARAHSRRRAPKSRWRSRRRVVRRPSAHRALGHGVNERSASISGPLVIVGSPTESEQQRAAREAQLRSAEATRKREESSSKFERLDGEEAATVASQTFPGVIDEAAGGVPRRATGATRSGFVSASAAQVELGDGESGLLQSLDPIAIKTLDGGWSAVI